MSELSIVETDILAVLDVDRTTIDSEAFAHAIGDLAVNRFGVSVDYLATERKEAESIPGQSFNVVSCIQKVLAEGYSDFESEFLDLYGQRDLFTYPDVPLAVEVLESAHIPIMSMTHGVYLDQRLKILTSATLRRFPFQVIDAPNKGQVIVASRNEDRYIIGDINSDSLFAAKCIGLADDKIQNFVGIEEGMRIIPFHMVGRARTSTDVELTIVPRSVQSLFEVADYLASAVQ